MRPDHSPHPPATRSDDKAPHTAWPRRCRSVSAAGPSRIHLVLATLLLLVGAACLAAEEASPGVAGPTAPSTPVPGGSGSRFFSRFDLRTNPLPFGLIAHALGTVDGRIYSNSREAFHRSLGQGFRLFEADLMPLSDGSVVALHPGAELCCALPADSRAWSRVDLASARFDGRYRLLWASDLLELLRDHPEVYLIADSKAPLPSSLSRVVEVAAEVCPSCLDRIIPHVGSEEELVALQALYPFPDYLFSVYRSSLSDEAIIEFVRRHQLHAVMMHWSWPRTPSLVSRLQALGVNCYVHSLGDPDLIREFLQRGVGVYSDGAFPDFSSPPGRPADRLDAPFPWWSPAPLPGLEPGTAVPSLIRTCDPGARIEGPGEYCLQFSGLVLRQIDVRFRVNGGEAGVMKAIVNAEGRFRSFVPCGTPPGSYRFEAVRAAADQDWIESVPAAVLNVR